MSVRPLISVLIPVRNTAQYLRACLDSVVNQTYDNLQIIIAENGSKDSSESICSEYQRNYNNIDVFDIPKCGISEVRQKLLNSATGEYIIFIDSDDWIEPKMIESLYEEVSNNNLDFISSQINKNKKSKKTHNDRRLQIMDRARAAEAFFSNRILSSLCVKLVSAKIYNKVEFLPEIQIAEDYYMTWRLINQSNRIGICYDSYYHYTNNPSSSTHNYDLGQLQTTLLASDTIVRDCSENWPQYLKYAQHSKAISALKLLYHAIRNQQDYDSQINNWQEILNEYIRQYHSISPAPYSQQLFAFLIRRSYNFCKTVYRLSRPFLLLIHKY